MCLAAKAQETIEHITATFSEQEQDYKVRAREHYHRVASLFADSQANSMYSVLGALTSVAVGLLSVCGLGAACIAFRHPELLNRTDLVRNWYKPDYRDWRGKLHYKKMTQEEGGCKVESAKLGVLMSGMVPAILVAGGLTFWSWRRFQTLSFAQLHTSIVHQRL